MLHNCYNLLCDRPIHTKDCRIIAIKIKIRRTKLCVLISIAVPSYLMLSANILTSVVNNSLSTFFGRLTARNLCPGHLPGAFFFYLSKYQFLYSKNLLFSKYTYLSKSSSLSHMAFLSFSEMIYSPFGHASPFQTRSGSSYRTACAASPQKS